MTSQIVRYSSSHGEIALSIADIKAQFCPKATDQEARTFLEVCRYQGLNPFLKEAYLVKYQESEPASIVVGKEVFTKRAGRIQECKGWEAGVLVARSDQLVQQEGSFVLPGDTLLGGWCKVYREGKDTFSHQVDLKEYIQTTREGRPTKFWSKMPATMIRKVALVQALRECFPEEFQGLYDSAEITGGQVIETTGHVVGQVDGVADDPAKDPFPELGTCPEHSTEWKSEERFGRVVASHHISGKDYCKFGDVYGARLRGAWEVRYGEFVKPEVDAWLKEHFNQKTWSKMEPTEMLEAMSLLTTLPDRPETATEAPLAAEPTESSPDANEGLETAYNYEGRITTYQVTSLIDLCAEDVPLAALMARVKEVTGEDYLGNIRIEDYEAIQGWVNREIDIKMAAAEDH